MIFPVIDCERDLQIGDKTRLLGVKSFVGKDDGPISKVEICPDYAGGTTTPPFSLVVNGYMQTDLVTVINCNPMTGLEVGMTVASDAFGSNTTTIASLDIPNYTMVLTDNLATTNGTFDFTVTRDSQTIGASPIWMNVSGRSEADWYLDWVYGGSSRTVVAAVRVTVGQVSQVALKSINLLTALDDALFSTDEDLIALEPSLNRYPPGRSSFLNVAREAKAKILEALSDKGIRNPDGTALTAAILRNKAEVRTWSRDLTLQLIFQGGSNSSDDVFFAKAKYYQGLADQRADRAMLSLTVPVNDSTQPFRSGQIQTMSLVR